MNRRFLLSVLPAGLLAARATAAWPQPAVAGVAPCRLASELRIGINVHPSDGAPPQILRALRMAGFDRYRVDATPSSLNEALAKAHLRGDYIVSDGPEPTGQLAFLRSLERSYPGSVEFIEGKNEVNNHRTTFRGVSDTSGADMSLRSAIKAYMNELTTNVRTDDILKEAKVIDHSDLHPMFAAGDFVNDHVYDGGANRSLWWWAPHEAGLMSMAAPGVPTAVTEWGFRTAGDKAITPQQQAASLVEGVASLLHAGVLVSYLYALRDDKEAYGIFNADWTPKPAVTALTTLMTALRSGGPPTPKSLSVQASSSQVNHLLVDKGAGRFAHLIWRPEAHDIATLSWTYDRPVNVEVRMLVSSLATISPRSDILTMSGDAYQWPGYDGGVLLLEIEL